MKWWFFSLIIIYSCGSNSSASLSREQRGLFTLCGEFKNDYEEARDSVTRGKLISNYEMKLQRYLTYTCDSSLKAMKVRMIKFEENGEGAVNAEFVDGNCRYVFHHVYDSTREMNADVVYHLVKSLKQNTEMTVRFLFGGNIKIYDPADVSEGNFEIEVIPTAIVG